MNITVVGTGYVGLVTGTCLAEMGNNVTCVDIDAEKIARMQQGEVPIYEPGLEDLFERNQRKGRLDFTTDLQKGMLGTAAVFLCLPTPAEEDGSADLSRVMDVARKIGPLIGDYLVIVNKSTVPVGTAKEMEAVIRETTDAEFDVVSNPEFLKEGVAVDDFQKPERIVIGTNSTRARKVMHDIYYPYIHQGMTKVIDTDRETAELSKYASNFALATRISMMNELADLCEATGADVDEVAKIIGADSRIGKKFLYAGVGYGGSCFPKDIKALKHMAEENGLNPRVASAVEAVNEEKKTSIPNRIRAFFGGDIKDKTFALWGLAFKANTDDVREAPSLAIIDGLVRQGAKVVVYDPVAMDNVRKLFDGKEGISFADDAYTALEDVDGLIIATEWREFYNPDFAKMHKLMHTPAIFDGRNLYDLSEVRGKGIYYESMGRAIIDDEAIATQYT